MVFATLHVVLHKCVCTYFVSRRRFVDQWTSGFLDKEEKEPVHRSDVKIVGTSIRIVYLLKIGYQTVIFEKYTVKTRSQNFSVYTGEVGVRERSKNYVFYCFGTLYCLGPKDLVIHLLSTVR